MTLRSHPFLFGAGEFTAMLDKVTKILEGERLDGIMSGGRINFGLVELDVPRHLEVVGDIHGDLLTMHGILEEINYKKFLSSPFNKLIFLGDYVDRGSNSLGVLYELCSLKQEYPGSVILMRGNHEAVVEFPFPSHDLPSKIIEVFGTLGETYEKILKLFQMLALAVIIEGRVFLVHGGLPVRIGRDFRESIARSAFDKQGSVLEDLLWNDPRPIEKWERSRRRYGLHFGRLVSKTFLEQSNTRAVIRGH